MSPFPIDSDNNITALAGRPADADESQSFSTAKELAKLTAEWPVSRLIDTWNGFAGAVPFDDPASVGAFNEAATTPVVARIWEDPSSVCPGDLPGNHGACRPAHEGEGEEVPGSRRPASGGAGREAGAKEERTNKKAEVIAMMKRAKGVTLAEIAELTAWQKHTIRGFVSIPGYKGGLKIESSKNAAGERSYHIAK